MPAPAHGPLRIRLLDDHSAATTYVALEGARTSVVRFATKGTAVSAGPMPGLATVDAPLCSLIGYTLTVEADGITFQGVIGYAAPPGPVELCCCH